MTKSLMYLLKIISIFLVFPQLDVFGSMDLAEKNGCFSCHKVDRKFIGPSFKAIGSRYSRKEFKEDYLIERVRTGSKGNWGFISMPAQIQLGEQEAKKLVEWILMLEKTINFVQLKFYY